MSRRKSGDFKTSFTVFIIAGFMLIILIALFGYFDKRNAIKIDGGRVNPYTSDFKQFSLDGLDVEGLDEHGNPDTEALHSMFKEFEEEMGQ